MAVPQKIKHRVTMWHSDPTSGATPKGSDDQHLGCFCWGLLWIMLSEHSCAQFGVDVSVSVSRVYTFEWNC